MIPTGHHDPKDGCFGVVFPKGILQVWEFCVVGIYTPAEKKIFGKTSNHYPIIYLNNVTGS